MYVLLCHIEWDTREFLLPLHDFYETVLGSAFPLFSVLEVGMVLPVLKTTSSAAICDGRDSRIIKCRRKGSPSKNEYDAYYYHYDDDDDNDTFTTIRLRK